MRVLLVEDDDDSRNLLRLVLERQGAEVIAASSSAEALSVFDLGNNQSPQAVSRFPDIIISDLGMPDEDGYELMRKIRGLLADTSPTSATISGTSNNIPAIALTGYATSKDRERALSTGYQLHLAKPVEPDDLIAGNGGAAA